MTRVAWATVIAVVVFVAFGQWYPWRSGNMLLHVIWVREPRVYAWMYWSWTLGTLLAPFFVGLLCIRRREKPREFQELPVYVEPEDRDNLYLVIGSHGKI